VFEGAAAIRCGVQHSCSSNGKIVLESGVWSFSQVLVWSVWRAGQSFRYSFSPESGAPARCCPVTAAVG